MENVLAMNTAGTCDGDVLDFDEFLKERLLPLLQQFKCRLSHCEDNCPKLVNKCRSSHLLDWHQWQHRWKFLEHMHSRQVAMQMFEEFVADLSEKYRELESLLADDESFEKAVDDTIEAIMSTIEQADARISGAVGMASAMRTQVTETIQGFAGMAHEQMDHLRLAIASGAKRLLHYDELPVPWRNNMYIHTGYRFLSTPTDCFHSWLYIHNETGNIYTHLFGFVFFLAVGIYELFYSSLLADVPLIDRAVFAIFFLAACKCLMCSTVWHTLSGINDYTTFTRMACLDYVGISVLICASIILCEHYGFYCSPVWRNTYVAGTGTLAVVGVLMPFMSWFDRADMRWIRIAFFITLASSGALPIGHLAFSHGPNTVMKWILPVAKSLACYLIGVVVYGNKLPEKIWPGRFDHFGHSHQLWHLFVCGGIWYHYVAACEFVGQRDALGYCPVPVL